MQIRGAIKSIILTMVCCCVAVLSIGPAFANTDIDLAVLSESETRQFAITEILEFSDTGQFQALDGKRISMGFRENPKWVRVTPAEGASLSGTVVWVDNPAFDQVEFYLPTVGGAVRIAVSGDMTALRTRSVNSTQIAVPLPDDLAGQIFLRISSNARQSANISIVDADNYDALMRQRAMVQTLFCGFVIALIIFNLSFFFFIRQPSFLLYAGFQIGMLGLENYLRGNFAFLAPELGGYANSLLLASVAIACAAGTAFFAAFMEIERHVARLEPIFRVIVMFSGAVGAVGLLGFIDLTLALQILISVGIVVIGLVAIGLILSYESDPRRALVMSLPFFVIGPGVIATVASALGLISYSFISNYAIELTIALEALFFSFVLSGQVRLLDLRRLDAEEQLQETRVAMAGKVIEAQDAERKRIARELHDSVGQNLVLLTSEIIGLTPKVGPDVKLDKLADAGRSALDELRRVSHNLHPPQLEHTSLSEAAGVMVRNLSEAADLDATIDLNALDQVKSLHMKTHLYRIVQEMMTNTVKHALASKISLVSAIFGNEISIRFEDDGKGMQTQPFSKVLSKSFGLASIHERVKSMRGRWRVDSAMGDGIRITIDIPLK